MYRRCEQAKIRKKEKTMTLLLIFFELNNFVNFGYVKIEPSLFKNEMLNWKD